MRNLPHLLCVALFFLLLMVQVSRGSVVSTGNFNQDFYITWSPDRVITSPDGRSRTLKLDYSSGSGFGSINKFIFGQYDMDIKLMPGYSADVCVTYYLQSPDGNTRDEIDYEFLGNVIGQPWILQTNVYINGKGNREERMYLWFDPAENFHTYSIHWNINQLVFMVDGIPIRVLRNLINEGGQYPINRPMDLLASIWAADWATGNTAINWTYAPFIASYKDYKIDACVCNGCDRRQCSSVSDTNWWNNDEFKSLSSGQRILFESVRKKFLNYDYCQDHDRLIRDWGTIPKECSLPKY